MFCYPEAVPKRSQCEQKQFWYTFYKVSFHYRYSVNITQDHTVSSTIFLVVFKSWKLEASSHDAFSYT